VREVPVIAEGNLAQHEVAHLVETVAADEVVRIDHIAERLRDLLAFVGPPAVREHALRRLQPSAHQKGRPVDGVKAQDVLADHVKIGRPQLRVVRRSDIGIADGGDVVGEGVEPHVHHVLLVPGHRNAPGETGPRDGQILQAAADEAHHLVAPALRCDEVGVVLVEFQQAILPGREAEEIARLFHPFDLGAARGDLLARRAVAQFALAIEGLVAHRVPARIGVEIDLAALDERRPQRLRRADVPFLGGPDEIVVREAPRLGQGAEVPRHAVREGLRVDAGLLRRLLHFLAVLVGPRQKAHVVTVEALEARQHVAGERRVGVPDVRIVVHIVDRGRDVVGLCPGHRRILMPRSQLPPQRTATADERRSEGPVGR